MSEMHHDIPREIVEFLKERFRPSAKWLFGSRARGDNRSDSDWDILVVDDARNELTDSYVGWKAASELRDRRRDTTVVVCTEKDVGDIWGLPNTLGYDLAREGVRIELEPVADGVLREDEPEVFGRDP